MVKNPDSRVLFQVCLKAIGEVGVKVGREILMVLKQKNDII